MKQGFSNRVTVFKGVRSISKTHRGENAYQCEFKGTHKGQTFCRRLIFLESACCTGAELNGLLCVDHYRSRKPNTKEPAANGKLRTRAALRLNCIVRTTVVVLSYRLLAVLALIIVCSCYVGLLGKAKLHPLLRMHQRERGVALGTAMFVPCSIVTKNMTFSPFFKQISVSTFHAYVLFLVTYLLKAPVKIDLASLFPKCSVPLHSMNKLTLWESQINSCMGVTTRWTSLKLC